MPPALWLPRKFLVLAGPPHKMDTGTAIDDDTRVQPNALWQEGAQVRADFLSWQFSLGGLHQNHLECGLNADSQASPLETQNPFRAQKSACWTCTPRPSATGGTWTTLWETLPGKPFAHYQNCARSLGFTRPFQWFLLTAEGVFNTHALGSLKVIRDDQAHIMRWVCKLFTINLGIII